MIKKINKKQFHNYFSGLSLKLTLVVSQIFLIPTFILELGAETYGEWLILTTIPNYLLLSDFGLTLTVTNEICRLINLKKYEQQESLYKSNLSFLSFIGLSLILIFLALSVFVDFSKILQLKYITDQYATLILSGFMVNVFFSLIYRVTIGYFKAVDLFHKHEYFLALSLFLDFIVTLLVLKLHWPIYYIPLLMALVKVFMILLINKILRRIDFYKVGFTLNWKPATGLIPVSLKLSFFQLGSALFIQGSTMIVGLLLGPTSVVIFNTIRVLVNSLKAFIGILYVPSMQEFTILLTKNLNEDARLKMKKLMSLVFVVSLVACSVIYISRDLIFTLWIGELFVYNKWFLIFMLLSVFLQNMWNSASMLPMSVNKLNELAYYPLLGIILLLIQIYLLPIVKLEGLAFSFIIMDMIMLLLVVRVNFRVLRIKEV